MPLTSRQGSVVGPIGGSPHRAMIAGSPQARTAAEDDDVVRGVCPPTVLGQWASADRHGADPASTGSLTSMDEHPSSPPKSTNRPTYADRHAPGWLILSSDVHDRARQGACDARDVLNLGDDQLAEIVDRSSLDAGDDVIGAGDVLGHGDAGDPCDRLGDLSRFPNFGLNQNVGLDHHNASKRT